MDWAERFTTAADQAELSATAEYEPTHTHQLLYILDVQRPSVLVLDPVR